MRSDKFDKVISLHHMSSIKWPRVCVSTPQVPTPFVQPEPNVHRFRCKIHCFGCKIHRFRCKIHRLSVKSIVLKCKIAPCRFHQNSPLPSIVLDNTPNLSEKCPRASDRKDWY